jgi:dTDP-4-amino-4,6-dideoxygalactose transaminase
MPSVSARAVQMISAEAREAESPIAGRSSSSINSFAKVARDLRSTDPSIAAIRVPFLDLSSTNAAVAHETLVDVSELLGTGAFTNGPHVGRFEEEFAAYCGVRHCVGLASGLDALRLALAGLGVGPGDEVLVPAMTFLATFEAVSQVGAVPVPVDVGQQDCCIDSAAAEAAATPRTRIILPVHLYGRLADMNALGAVANSSGLQILEDACQAHGASRDGVRAGTAGVAAAFSFYPGKNLGAMGDAGALVTDDPDLAQLVRALREHGQGRKYEHDLIGWTARLDTIQAAFLLRKLPLLDSWNEERRAAADLYNEGLSGVGDLVLPDTSDRGQVWHVYVVRTADRDGLAAYLSERGVGTGRHYPEPPHLSRAYAHLGFAPGSFPVAERLAGEVLSLPIFPGIASAQVERVVESVRAWFADG